MKFCTLLLAGKHACLKPAGLSVLLWTTVRTAGRGSSAHRRRQRASLCSQAWTKTLLGSFIYPSGQSSGLASTLLTSPGQRRGHSRGLQNHSAQKKSDITRRERRHPTAGRARHLQTSKAQTPLRSSVRLKACLQAMTLLLLTGGTLVPATEMLCY